MIIGLTGYAQSGKDTVANILVRNYSFTRIAFADPIRDFLYAVNPMAGGEPIRIRVDSDGWDKAKRHPEVRRLLQSVGLTARTQFGQDFWVYQAISKMEQAQVNRIVVTDVRFTNEAKTLKELGAQLWRIKRVGVGAVNGHVSETELDTYPVDQTFANNGSIEDLELSVKTRIQGLL